MDKNEFELISAAKNGDREALGKLIELNAGKVYNLCYRLSGSDSDAKDLSQDVFITVLRFIKQFNQKSGFSTWLYRIAVNLWINKNKRGNKMMIIPIDKRVDSENNDESKPQISGTDLSPEQKAVSKELEKVVQTALESLAPEQRVAIVLKYIESKSLIEIAKICNCSVNTIGSRLARGLRVLRKYLGQYMSSEE